MEDRFSKLRIQFIKTMLIVVACIALADIGAFFFVYKPELSMTWQNYGTLFFWMPLVINGGLQCALWGVIDSPNVSPKVKDYITVLDCLLVCLVTCTFHCYSAAAFAIFAVPVVWSTVYSDRFLTKFTFIASEVGVFALLFMTRIIPSTSRSEHIGYSVVIAMICVSVSYLLAILLASVVKESSDTLQLHLRDNVSLEKRLLRDPMTGLYNHSAFYSFLDQMVKEHGDEPLSLAVVDIDNFKRVNDTYGHNNGDTVILTLSNVLQKHCGENAYVCRYGGEEFAVIFPGVKVREAKIVMDNVLEDFRNQKYGWHKEMITFSCGIFQLSAFKMTATEFFQVADKMLYQAKHSGKNQCVSG